MTSTQPLMTVIAQRFAGGVRPGIMSISCISVAFFGVFSVVTRWQFDMGMERKEVIGDLMVLSGALCWVIYTIRCVKYSHWSNLRLTTISMVAGALANTLIVVVLVVFGSLDNPSAADWYSVRYELIFLAFVGVLGAMFGWNIGARALGPLNAMLFINLIPVVTFLIRYLQGYRFVAIELFGAMLVIGALLTQNFILRRRLALKSLENA